MFENVVGFFKKLSKKEKNKESSDTAKERLHLVLMQDRANVSADFLELMKQEIIEVIKKYIDVDEKAIDVKLTNKSNEDGTTGAPALYANIPIVTIKNEARKVNASENTSQEKGFKAEEAKKEEVNEVIEEKQEDKNASEIKEEKQENIEAKQEEINEEDKKETFQQEPTEVIEEINEKQTEEQPKVVAN